MADARLGLATRPICFIHMCDRNVHCCQCELWQHCRDATVALAFHHALPTGKSRVARFRRQMAAADRADNQAYLYGIRYDIMAHLRNLGYLVETHRMVWFGSNPCTAFAAGRQG